MSTAFWQAEPAPPRARLEGDVRADVCVVGAGIAGLATAWHLLDRGVVPALVEAREVAAGASGRNGGFFIAGAAPMYHSTRQRWGRERARRLHAATLAAQDEMMDVAAQVGAGHHFRRTGLLRLAVDAREGEDVRAHAAALAEDGFAGELVAGDELPAVLRRPDRSGLFLPGDGTVHPVRWLRDLARACERRGARIFENSPVRPPAGDAAGVVVAGESGRVLAGHAVIAMDAGLARWIPVARAVRPRRLQMLATAPEPVRRLPFPVYARYGCEYAQQLPGGEVTLGGFSDVDGEASWTDSDEVSGPVQSRLEAYLRDELGVRAPVTHRWAGVVGYAGDPLPRCGPVPGTGGRVLALGGYNGTGHVQAWVAGGIVAGMVATGDASACPYASLDA